MNGELTLCFHCTAPWSPGAVHRFASRGQKATKLIQSSPDIFLRYKYLTLCKMTLIKIITGFTYPKVSGSWCNKAQQEKKLNYSLHKGLQIRALLSSQKGPIWGVSPLSSFISSIICSVLWSVSVLLSETNSACHQFPVLLVNLPFVKLFKGYFVKHGFIFFSSEF